MQTKQMTYRQAMGELKTIVDRLRDGEDVDVDELVANVARAKELIDFCGSKIKKADATIKGIVAELQTTDETIQAVVPYDSSSRNGDRPEDIPF